MSGYKHNHYVPIWYQRRFMLPDQRRYYRLDLRPDVIKTENGKYTRNDVHHWSPDGIFAEDDLYTTRWGRISNTDIEQFFFGRLDNAAPDAVEYFSNLAPGRDPSEKAFMALLPYMSVQKLRTPKGLADLAERTNSNDANMTLLLLQRIQNLFCAIWTEAVWQIADASGSPTKFIISDHPVTVYNRACPPLSKSCLGHNDPDIRLNASHTYFPLSLDKVLILTNLSWVRDPYQNEMRSRPNLGFFRDTIFNFLAIQTGRVLSEDEVLQINLITKRRAFRYIAAAEKEWLYPERHVSTDNWRKLGAGYLLMPEPRLIQMGGEILVGYRGGGGDSFSEYGQKPWEKGYRDEDRSKRETEMLYRFQAEWAVKRGVQFTARNDEFSGRLIEDSPEMMEEHRKILRQYSRK